jgi:heptosyltransferase-2
MIKKILIIKLDAIGDVLRTTWILRALKEKYKNCRITWITSKSSYPILENNDYIDEILILNKNLSLPSFDLVISLDEDYNACKLASSVNTKKLIGAYLKNHKRTYTKSSALWFGMGLLGGKNKNVLKRKNKMTYQQIISKIVGLPQKKYEMILNLSSNEIEFANSFARKHSLFGNFIIGINTGAGARWQNKKWKIKHTAELINKLNNNVKNIKIILFGGKAERQRNKKIKELINTKIIDAGCNNTIREFCALINLCDLVISTDTLAMHIAIALKKKVIALFGPTSSSEIELYGRGEKIVAPVDCVCCYKKKCKKKPSCMDKITPDMVFNKFLMMSRKELFK